jgi:hypothetical protein
VRAGKGRAVHVKGVMSEEPGAMGQQLGAGRRQYGLLTSKFPPVSASFRLL